MIAAALLLLAAQPGAESAPPPPPAVAAPATFAPPTGQPMTYRVTMRRVARDGSLASYTLVYALEWQRAGRGLQLTATLRTIESDARPELAQALTRLLQPLVGQDTTYLVAPDGSSVDLVDPEGVWQRVVAKMEALGTGAAQPEARQMASLLASLPPAEREKLITAHIRALVAPANGAIPHEASADVSIGQEGGLRTITRVERTEIAAGAAAQPLEIDTRWTVDGTTGLVMGEKRQSWTTGADGKRTLVEERERALTAVR